MVFRASLFGAFGEAKRWLARNPDGSIRALAPVDFYKAGAITGFVAAFTEGPIDFYKSQIQVQIIKSRQNADYKPPYTSVSACVKATWQQSGLRGPFQGLTATLVRNTPANAIYLGNFEMLKAAYCRRMQCSQADIPGWVVLCSAGEQQGCTAQPHLSQQL
ncbi:hypothetical protein QJQ45_008283 [Haematococcus lacustris]|nr:hypothetical protein QJQ45_008283 [Haematococcus lacustris]